jgi:DUF1680 family protein
MNRMMIAIVLAAVVGLGLAVLVRGGLDGRAAAPEAAGAADYPITPVPFTEVGIDDGFWLQRIETNREVTIPFAMQQNEITGRVANFLKAGGLAEGNYEGERYNDTDVYKVLEGAAFSLSLHPDPQLDGTLDEVIAAIGAAQEEDGYLFTPRSAPSDELPIGIGEERWSNLAVSHELYNAGHLYEAAVAHYQATGKRSFLDIAIRNADLVYDTFGPDRIRAAPGHQVIEMGLVKLYRVTGDERYLELAKFFLEQRGRELVLKEYPEGHRFDIYNDPVQIQAHKPLLEQTEAVGHSVRAMYQYAGMADVAAITGDARFAGAMDALWEDVVARKLYLTGGVGSRHGTEGFGDPYELPNDSGYAETCASIGLVFWSWRLFLTTGEAQYLDVLERVLYNGLIVGVSLEGDRFFYPNPLESNGDYGFNQGEATRKPWFGTACCPGNVTRFLPAVPGIVYAHRASDLFVANFVPGEATVPMAAGPVTVRQQTDYPWDGSVRILVDPVAEQEITIRVRIPGWARNEPVPSDLYRYADDAMPDWSVAVDGEPAAARLEDGFVVLDRAWSPGSVIDLNLPMPVRHVRAHEAVEADRGRVALERGPLVYVAEAPDNDGAVLGRSVAPGAAFAAANAPTLLGGLVTLQGQWSDGGQLTAIPYFAWSHRGAGEMAAWLPLADTQ